MWQPQGIYNEYILRTPVLLVGDESVVGLYNYPATKIAVIHGTSFTDHELFKRVFKNREIRFLVRSWKEEPDMNGLRGTLHDLEVFSPDTIIAVGGGSVIDGAKLCRLFYEVPYFIPGMTKIDGDLLTTKFIAVPTTMGSGAEGSSAAVYLENDHKEMIVIHELQPDVVVYDKRYLKSIPDRLLCACVIDAMSHTVEGYVSNIRNSIIEIKAEEALRLIKSEMDKYLDDADIDYLRLQYAGFLGGIIQNHCIVGANHAIAHQLNQFGFSHGEGIALLFPAVINMNSKCEEVRIRYETLCENSGFNGIDDLVGFVERICEKSGIGKRKEELKKTLTTCIKDDAFIKNVKNDRGGKGNPVEITDEYINELIRSI